MHRFWSIARIALPGGAIAAALACGSLSTSTTTSLPLCSGAVTIDISFDQPTTPTFSWRPACGISSVAVFASDTTTIWEVSAPALRPFGPGIRYGESPAGSSVWIPAQPLKLGMTYRVELTAVVGGDGVTAQADTTFTVPSLPD